MEIAFKMGASTQIIEGEDMKAEELLKQAQQEVVRDYELNPSWLASKIRPAWFSKVVSERVNLLRLQQRLDEAERKLKEQEQVQEEVESTSMFVKTANESLHAELTTLRSLLEEAEREMVQLRSEVREWICLKCDFVYPGPPQEGFKCVICPRCGGETAKRNSAAEVALLRSSLEEACRKAFEDGIHASNMGIDYENGETDRNASAIWWENNKSRLTLPKKEK